MTTENCFRCLACLALLLSIYLLFYYYYFLISFDNFVFYLKLDKLKSQYEMIHIKMNESVWHQCKNRLTLWNTQNSQTVILKQIVNCSALYFHFTQCFIAVLVCKWYKAVSPGVSDVFLSDFGPDESVLMLKSFLWSWWAYGHEIWCLIISLHLLKGRFTSGWNTFRFSFVFYLPWKCFDLHYHFLFPGNV